MDIHIDITANIFDQFDSYLNLVPVGGGFKPDQRIIEGEMNYLTLPGQLEFYHFKHSIFKVPITMHTSNPRNTDWYLIHVNLSAVAQQKHVGDRTIHFQRKLPMGVLLYGPGLEIITRIPGNTPSEVASIRFSKKLFSAYFSDEILQAHLNKNLLFEDLDRLLESKLMLALNNMGNKIKCHAALLEFMQALFDKILHHNVGSNIRSLHPNDLNAILKSSSYLRNPTPDQPISISVLARESNMSLSKFKRIFSMVFGKPPMKYHHKIKMEYARHQLHNCKQSPTEVSILLGYAHPSNFTAAYKRHYGHLPSDAQI